MKIYTRTGDHQTTSIISKRIHKDHIILECIGTIDELQASLMVASNFTEIPDVKERVIGVVKDLFGLSKTVIGYFDADMITADHVRKIETCIDYFEGKLPPLREFILPGNTVASSHLHLSRTVVRRLERRLVTMGKSETLKEEVYQYVNRLSDLLFVMARYQELNL
jgi:cob(I)alamin adenosyltransferase